MSKKVSTLPSFFTVYTFVMAAPSGVPSSCMAPVSYTHLDVYKRQDDSTSGRYIGHTDAILSPEGVAELHRLKEQADYPYVCLLYTSRCV